MANKKVRQPSKETHGKRIPNSAFNESAEQKYFVWRFDMIDRNGPFNFNLNRSDIQHKKLLDIIMIYSARTWFDIEKDTHDSKGKTKHHFLDANAISREGWERIRALRLEDDADIIFSLAINNIERIIGLRKGSVFHAIWYDAQHGFCPSKR